MERRDFLRYAGIGAGSTLLLHSSGFAGALTPIPTADRKALADAALNTATANGATYADIRIGRYLNQSIFTREDKVQNISNTESFGFGVRVIVEGTWGFAASSTVTNDEVEATTRQAVAIARANAKLQTEPVQLAPVPGYGEVSWETPIRTNAFEVPIAQKADLLLAINDAAAKAGASFCASRFFFVNEDKYFASTEGSYIAQNIHRCWPTFTVTNIDRSTGKFQSRNALCQPIGMGYEYIEEYPLIEEAREAAEQAREKHNAKSVEPGQYDLVLDPTHLFLTIHESVGHPLELDRVLGYEANYAGTSFATLDKWRSGDFNYGSEIVNFFADKTQPNALGTCGYDDDGVQTKRWDLVKDGILVNYQAIRDQVHILGQNESHACCYADSWSSIPFQRMPNVSLAPGPEPLTVEQMIAGVEKGIYIKGRGSYSIDQQRYNFQFGGQLFYEIANGQIVGMLSDVAYQSNTQEFWNACVQLCDERDYALGGTFRDGKGQPGQVSAVSHGCPTTRFNGINVLNTGRKI